MRVKNDGHRADLAESAHFCPENCSPYDTVQWEQRTALVQDDNGNIIFEQQNVEVPADWSQSATNIVASKYFYGKVGTPGRETSVRQLVHRVCATIALWAVDGEYMDAAEAKQFYNDLAWLLLHQYASFNSPVWFNLGVHKEYGVTSGGGQSSYRYDPSRLEAALVDPMIHPQCSACFIVSVRDSIRSIWETAGVAAQIFKYGSGFGADWSTLRGKAETLSGGGRASGPVSFMGIVDKTGGTIKSGGRTRRAANMFTLKCHHPDVEEFVNVKLKEERKARALIAAGYEADFNGEAYSTVGFQNANLSLRVTDAFMEAATTGRNWQTCYVTDTNRPAQRLNARTLLRQVAEGTWWCGDPGLQYEDTIQKWHTLPNHGPINSSNPCSEYMSIDDSACNLASLNLLRFLHEDGQFDVERFQRAVRIMFTAQDILVENASYPTAKIAENAYRYRQLGLGYANLGALLMASGLPYDSDEGRAMAAAVTALMTGEAYATSARLAAKVGAFDGYAANREPMLNVIRMHAAAAYALPPIPNDPNLTAAARNVWAETTTLGEENGFRNSQATVLAPTGTISFMMDCDTTGVEPELALVKYKLLAGGGRMKIVNQTVSRALRALGYEPEAIVPILAYIAEHGRVEGYGLDERTLAVFDTSFKIPGGERCIHWRGHLKMLGALQPFISGAISKTINMPEDSSVEDIFEAYVEGWRLEVKALAIYRENSKGSQPLSTQVGEVAKELAAWGQRRRMPVERQAFVRKFSVDGHEGYFTVGLYEDGTPGEIFVCMAKEGSTLGGMMDAISILTSIGLQHGVPLDLLVRKMSYVHFEPSGFTDNKEIPIAKSIVDYIFRWLGMRFCAQDGTPVRAEVKRPGAQSGPPCANCGAITQRAGACYSCSNCGQTTGCG